MPRNLVIRPAVEQAIQANIERYPEFAAEWERMKNHLRTQPYTAAHILGTGISFLTSRDMPGIPTVRVIYSIDPHTVDVLAAPPN